MKNRSSYAVLTRFGIIAAILATLVLIAPAATAASECELDGDTVKCMYEENGTDPVATFSAADDEGDATTWSLKELDDDYKKFSISADGSLTFMSPPDFDAPGDVGEDNVYNVTVVADGGSRADGDLAVEVTVTDVNEHGTVTFKGNQQPQVDQSTAAKLEDEDGSFVRLSWQWSKGSSMEGPWENVSSTSGSYTPKAADIDSYLRATVSYTDVEFDAPDTVSGVTKLAVRARPTANSAPTFSAQSIEVFENTDGTIGTVTAKDDDELIYSMAMGDELNLDPTGDADDSDNASFTISDSGELKLAAKLDFEQVASGDFVNSTTDVEATSDIVEYTAIVTATDPSGASGSGAVIIHLLNVDEAPEVTVTSGADDNAVSVAENSQLAPPIVFQVGTDPEGAPAVVAAPTAWELEGADALKFTLVAGSLTFKGDDDAADEFRPNYEKPADADADNVYEVTVVVPVTGSVKPGMRSVKITVTDAEDIGTLKIAAREPQVGTSVSGTLTDEDGGLRDREWQWYRGGASGVTDGVLVALDAADGLCSATAATADVACRIDKAQSPTYATTKADGGFFVHLVVSYTDAFIADDEDENTEPATLVARPAREVQLPPVQNDAPKYGIQDREIDGDDAAPESVTRNVDEGTTAVGDFEATDTVDLVDYTLGGADGAMFSLSDPDPSGNRVTLSLKAALDFENPADADGDNAYEVSITAKDPSGATDTLMVTVMVDDVDDAPEITLAGDSTCEMDGDTVKCMYEENGTDPVATFSVADDEGDATTWSLKELDDDYEKFSISADGVLTFMAPPDFDSAGDVGADNVYNVTVQADGGSRADGDLAVEVTVTDVNEPGTVTFKGNQQPQVDQSTAAKLEDEDGSFVRLSWQWSKSSSMEGPWENVSSTSGSYTPKAADIDSYLRATVSYTDVEFDAPDTVSGVTSLAVRARPAANAAPTFSAQSIEVFENTDGTIGTVTAKDDDELIYSMAVGLAELDLDTNGTADDNDNDRFTIEDSGELKLVDKLDFEQVASGDFVNSTTDVEATSDIVEYTAIVTATDPSGASGSGAVIIHLLNVDEAPEVTVTSGADDNAVSVAENSQLAPPIVFQVGTDPEGAPAVVAAPTAWELEGADALKFTLVAGSLTFKGDDDAADEFRPNYEKPADADADNVYEVTVVVPVTGSVKPGMRSVKITVTDAEDIGTLKIAAREPQVGTSVSGTLTDEDGGLRDREWQWYRGGASGVTDGVLVALDAADGLCSATAATADVACRIDKAQSPTYATTKADGGFFVHLVVSYTDAFIADDEDENTEPATLVARPAREVQRLAAENDAPKYGIQDREIDGDDAAPESVTRNVDEGTTAVGDFEATDTVDLVDYTLGGADGAMFSLSDPDPSGNRVTLSLKAALDFENPADADGDNAYEVSITAKDPSGATDTLMVTVMVEDVDDAPMISLRPVNTVPAFADDAETDFMVDENMPAGTSVGTVMADDAEGDVLTYTDDSMYFAVDDMGNITTTMMLDYETTPSHTVTVTATDAAGLYAMITVTIAVNDVPETPMFEANAVEFEVDENMPVGTAVGTVTAIYAESYSDGSDYFDVDNDGNITTAMMLDHEAMDSHTVTVTAASNASDETDSIAVTVTVGDAHADCTVMDNMGLTNDCEALLDAKGDLGGDLNWDTDTAMADWEGVTMSEGRVSEVWLKEKSLDGSVSAAFGRLDMLTLLNLHSNSLSGTIPDLSGASMLEGLYLAGNADYVTNDDGKNKKVKVDGTGLTGEIPMWLNGMTNLTNLWLWGNQLTGGIPDLSGLTNLDKLKLADNDLTGNINAMYLPSSLTWLIIDRNGFDGSIPDLSGLTSLELLWLHTNEFTGAVPDGTMLPASLDDLNLRDNMLTGMIPDLSALDSLTRLRLHNNSLSGAVPGSLGGLDSLKQLWLHNETDDDGMLIGNNMLTSIDDGVGGLSDTLIEIQLGGNPWADDACVPDALADVATNDYEAAGIAVCGADDGS